MSDRDDSYVDGIVLCGKEQSVSCSINKNKAAEDSLCVCVYWGWGEGVVFEHESAL